MSRDITLRLLFIPLLGILLPLISGIVTYQLYRLDTLLLINLYFMATSFAIWSACHWMHIKIRPIYPPLSHLGKRMFVFSLANTLLGTCISCLSVLGWLQLSPEPFSWNTTGRFVLACATVVIIFTLVYEILFLTKEKEQDSKIVSLLDQKRSQAEIYALQNEMDPHFLFNSLNTLNHLIENNTSQAFLYNNKLAQVYKYFLINKNKSLTSLKDELDFINDYFYLLELRFDKNLQMEIKMNIEYPENIRIPPCSLQILLENAIKHNYFSNEEPLLIEITINHDMVKVVNKIRPKPFVADSTRIGLNNLRSRYKLLFDKDIIIKPCKENFAVSLPVIR